jgi:hypothetical protein
LIGFVWAHEIRSASRGKCGGEDQVRGVVERASSPEAIGPGNRNSPVGCPASGIESAVNGDWVGSKILGVPRD